MTANPPRDVQHGRILAIEPAAVRLIATIGTLVLQQTVHSEVLILSRAGLKPIAKSRTNGQRFLQHSGSEANAASVFI